MPLGASEALARFCSRIFGGSALLGSTPSSLPAFSVLLVSPFFSVASVPYGPFLSAVKPCAPGAAFHLAQDCFETPPRSMHGIVSERVHGSPFWRSLWGCLRSLSARSESEVFPP